MTKFIFCFDGTCNDPADAGDFFHDGSISNVLKLHAIFGGRPNQENSENSQIPNQHSFYYSGVGTYGGWFRRKINSMLAPPNADLKDILKTAKEDLDKVKDGDEIFIFGFSRGAAIARMFVSTIDEEDKKVKFLGVFDTVAAIKGVELDPNTSPACEILFENGTMGQHIESAVHLVSIDEKRLAFRPTLFNKDKRITEVWFAGVHSDIGGSYWFDGLSDITLDFMRARAKTAGLQILKVDEIDYSVLQGESDSKEYAICVDDIFVHPNAKGILHEQNRPSIIAHKTLAPRTVRVNVNDLPSSDDLPIVHHTVCERFDEVTGYRPYALRNTRYRVMEAAGEVKEEVRTGVAMLSDEDRWIK